VQSNPDRTPSDFNLVATSHLSEGFSQNLLKRGFTKEESPIQIALNSIQVTAVVYFLPYFFDCIFFVVYCLTVSFYRFQLAITTLLTQSDEGKPSKIGKKSSYRRSHESVPCVCNYYLELTLLL